MFDHELVKHWQFLATREVPDRGICVLQEFMFTRGLLTNVKLDYSNIDYDARYCYESFYDALRALQAWDGVGDPPGDWIKEKVSDRLGPGACCKVHTDTFFTLYETIYCCPQCKSPFGR